MPNSTKTYQHIDLSEVIARCKETAALVQHLAGENTARGVQIRLFLAANEALGVALADEINRNTDVEMQSAGLCMMISDVICDFADGLTGDSPSERKAAATIAFGMAMNLISFIDQRYSSRAPEVVKTSVAVVHSNSRQ